MREHQSKAQIHSRAEKIKELSDIPYMSSTEQEQIDELKKQIQYFVSKTELDNEIDHADFVEFMEELFGEDHEFEIPEPKEKNETKSDHLYDDLDDDLDELDDEDQEIGKNQAIPQIKQARQKIKNQDGEYAQLKKRKEQLEMMKKKERLKKQVEKMEDELREQQKEESYLTEKPDKEGIVKLREDKYIKRMDMYNVEKLKLEQMLENEKDPANQKQIKESIKQVNGKIRELQMVKVQTKIKNFMTKLPRWINKGTKSIGEISDGFANMGGDMGKIGNSGSSDYSIGDNPFDLSGGKSKSKGKKKKGKGKKKSSSKSNDYDYGFNEKDMFKKGGGW